MSLPQRQVPTRFQLEHRIVPTPRTKRRPFIFLRDSKLTQAGAVLAGAVAVFGLLLLTIVGAYAAGRQAAEAEAVFAAVDTMLLRAGRLSAAFQQFEADLRAPYFSEIPQPSRRFPFDITLK